MPGNASSPLKSLHVRIFTAVLLLFYSAMLFHAWRSLSVHKKIAGISEESLILKDYADNSRLLLRDLDAATRGAIDAPRSSQARQHDLLAARLSQLTGAVRDVWLREAFPALVAEIEDAVATRIETERRAISLAATRHKAAALGLLSSPEYLRARSSLEEAASKISAFADAGLRRSISGMRGFNAGETRVYAGLAIFGVLIWALAVLAWLKWSRERTATVEILLEKEEHYRDIFNHVQDVIFRTDLAGIIQEISPSAGRFGYSCEELMGRRVTDLYADPEERAKLIKRLLAKGEVGDYEVRLKTKDGRVLDASVNAHVVRGPLGIPQGLEGSLRDISARKKAERAVAAHAARIEAMLRTSPAAIIAVDPGGVVASWNKSAEALFGWTEEEVLGRFNPVVPEYKREDFRRTLAAELKGEHLVDLEVQGKRKDGSLVDISLSLMPTRGPSGEAIGGMAFILDITDRKKAVEDLKLAKERAERILKIVPSAVFTVDKERRVTSWSDMAEKLTGYSAAEMVGTACDTVLVDPCGKHCGLYDGAMPKPITNKECVIRRKSGELRQVLKNADLFRDQRGEVTGGIESFIDITENKTLEQQLRQAQKMEAVGKLAGGVAHDFNNLLTAIFGYVRILRDQFSGPDPRRRDLDEINAAAERAAMLTRQLLAFSRRQTLLPKVINLNEVLRNITGMLQRLLGENVTLNLDLCANLSDIKADPGQMEQVIMNLAINARDAMPEGGTITAETSNAAITLATPGRHEMIPPGNYATLSIRDTGCGIDAEAMAHIFEPFFTTKASGAGTGLGLSTVYGIVKQSNGYVWAYSEPGRGTRFKIYMPVAGEEKKILPPEQASELPPGGSETIILVEDEANVREAMGRMLRSAGYTVIEARDGGDALGLPPDLLNKADLVLTDLVMPKLGGRELAARLRETRPELPVIFMSGYSEGAAVTGLEKEAVFLQKPIIAETMFKIVREQLDLRAENKHPGR